MKIICLTLLSSLLFLGNANAQLTSSDSADTQVGKNMTKAIWAAAQVYYWDSGRWPSTVEELFERHGHKSEAPGSPPPASSAYLELDSATLAQWQFNFVPGPPQTIRARTVRTHKVKLEGSTWIDRSAVMVDYDVLRGRWKGTSIPEYGKEKLTVEHQAELASDAKACMLRIAEGVQQYYSDKGEWPESVERLEHESHILIPHDTEAQWKFGIVGTPPQAIVAISTENMPDGVGKTIEYERVTKEWRGYGVK